MPLEGTPLNGMLCPQLNLKPAFNPSQAQTSYDNALAHFTSIPWCASLLPPHAPSSTVVFSPQCRNPYSPKHDQLFGATLASSRSAISHVLCFFDDADNSAIDPDAPPVSTISTLFAVGDGISGHPGVAHGGAVVAMADEAMGMIMELNLALEKKGPAFSAAPVTATLDTKYRRPVPTGEGPILVTAWMDGTEGRKTTIRCEVKSGNGEVLASCTSTWATLKAKV